MVDITCLPERFVCHDLNSALSPKKLLPLVVNGTILEWQWNPPLQDLPETEMLPMCSIFKTLRSLVFPSFVSSGTSFPLFNFIFPF